jgi:predicted nucleic-acid-binding Zn-ribbon protein
MNKKLSPIKIEETKYRCPICDYTDDNYKEMIKHMKKPISDPLPAGLVFKRQIKELADTIYEMVIGSKETKLLSSIDYYVNENHEYVQDTISLRHIYYEDLLHPENKRFFEINHEKITYTEFRKRETSLDGINKIKLLTKEEVEEFKKVFNTTPIRSFNDEVNKFAKTMPLIRTLSKPKNERNKTY